MNNKFFEFEGSNFSEGNMKGRDKGDDRTRDNSGRYALFSLSNIPHCYTLEAHYTRATTLTTLYNQSLFPLKLSLIIQQKWCPPIRGLSIRIDQYSKGKKILNVLLTRKTP